MQKAQNYANWENCERRWKERCRKAQKKPSIIGMNSLLNRENYLLIVSLKEMETIKNTTHIDNFC